MAARHANLFQLFTTSCSDLIISDKNTASLHNGGNNKESHHYCYTRTSRIYYKNITYLAKNGRDLFILATAKRERQWRLIKEYY